MTQKSIDPKWVINRQGKDFVLYVGLLDLAHRIGLASIETRIHQVGGENNGRMHIVVATVTMQDGRSFTGIGDADPSNVSKMILPSALRMAETRAKARALRDACNISMATVEELAEEEPPAKKPPAHQAVNEAKKQLWRAAKAWKPDAETASLTAELKAIAEGIGADLGTVAGNDAVLSVILDAAKAGELWPKSIE